MTDPGDGQEDFPTRTTNSLSTTYDEHLHRILTTAWIQHKNRDKTGVPTERTLKSLLSLIGFGRLETIRAWFEERVDMEQRAKLYKEGKVPDSQQTRCGEKRERNDSGHSSEGSPNSVASKTNKISLEQQARSSPNPSATNPSAIHPSAIHPSSSTSSFSFSSSTTPYPPPSPTASPQLTSSQHSPKRSSTLDAIRATYPPLVCPGCHKTFPNRNQVKDHVRDHHHGHFVYRCIVPECDHALESLCGLENHLRSSHDKRDITSAPTLPIPPSRSSLPPKKRHFSSSPSPCPTASQDDLLVASTRTTFRPRLPYGTAHPDGPIPPPRLPSPDTALALATDEHWCPVCRRQLTSNRGVDRHLRERHPFVRPFRCPIRGCGGEFASLGSRADHLRKRHVRAGKNNDDDGMVDADIHADADGMDVDNGYGLLTEGKLSPFPHYDSYDHDSDARLLSTDDGDDGNDRQRETAYVLASRLFRCPLCPESPSLTSKAQVDTHIREKHRGARPFGCAAKGCASKFSSLLARRNHVITKHQGVERENEEAVEGSEGEGNEVESAQQEARYDADESEDDDDDCPNPAETPARRDSHPTPLSCSPTSSSTPSPTSQGCGPPHRRARYVCPVTGCDTRFRGNKALGAHLHVVHQEGISELDPESSDDGRGPEKKQRSLLVTVRMSGRRDRRRCAESPVLCDRRHSSPILKDRARSNRRSGSLCVEYRMPPPARVAVKCLRCEDVFNEDDDMHAHLLEVHAAVLTATLQASTEGKFPCPVRACVWRLGRRSDIVRHLRHTHQLEILEGDEVSTKSIGVSDGPVDSVPSGMDSSHLKSNDRSGPATPNTPPWIRRLQHTQPNDINTPAASPHPPSSSGRHYNDTNTPVTPLPPSLYSGHHCHDHDAETPVTPPHPYDHEDDILTHTALVLTTLANESTPRRMDEPEADYATPPSLVMRPSYEFGIAPPPFEMFGIAARGMHGRAMHVRWRGGRGYDEQVGREEGGGLGETCDDGQDGRLDRKSFPQSNVAALIDYGTKTRHDDNKRGEDRAWTRFERAYSIDEVEGRDNKDVSMSNCGNDGVKGDNAKATHEDEHTRDYQARLPYLHFPATQAQQNLARIDRRTTEQTSSFPRDGLSKWMHDAPDREWCGDESPNAVGRPNSSVDLTFVHSPFHSASTMAQAARPVELSEFEEGDASLFLSFLRNLHGPE